MLSHEVPTKRQHPDLIVRAPAEPDLDSQRDKTRHPPGIPDVAVGRCHPVPPSSRGVEQQVADRPQKPTAGDAVPEPIDTEIRRSHARHLQPEAAFATAGLQRVVGVHPGDQVVGNVHVVGGEPGPHQRRPRNTHPTTAPQPGCESAPSYPTPAPDEADEANRMPSRPKVKSCRAPPRSLWPGLDEGEGPRR